MYHTSNFITKSIRKFKDTHLVSWHRLCHRLYQDLLTCIRQQFSFPPRKFIIQPSINWWKVLHLFLPTKDGRPRYFSYCLMIFAPNLFLMSSWIGCGVLWLKKKGVLSWFNYWTNSCSYVFNMVIMLEHSSFVAQQKIRLSSAKTKWEIAGPLAQAAIPLMALHSIACLINAESPFAQNKNRYGKMDPLGVDP